jgi:hypothetical protein
MGRELGIIRMRMGRVLRLLLRDVVDVRIIVRGLARMVVITSELEVVRMRMGRVLRVLLGNVVDFRIIV